MKLVETLKSRTGALKVAEVAKLFGVTPQHIYKIPSFRISGSVHFDPDEVAAWLKEKQAPAAASRRIGSPRVAAYILVRAELSSAAEKREGQKRGAKSEIDDAVVQR